MNKYHKQTAIKQVRESLASLKNGSDFTVRYDKSENHYDVVYSGSILANFWYSEGSKIFALNLDVSYLNLKKLEIQKEIKKLFPHDKFYHIENKIGESSTLAVASFLMKEMQKGSVDILSCDAGIFLAPVSGEYFSFGFNVYASEIQTTIYRKLNIYLSIEKQ